MREAKPRDYKAVRIHNASITMLCSVDNQSLVDFVNTQPLTNPLVCLGDGHDGISNLVGEFATPMSRWEILEWYHSNGKSLALLGGRAQRLAQAGDLLWQGNVDAAYALAC